MTAAARTALGGRRAYAVWLAALSVYMLAVFHRTSLGVAGLLAADRPAEALRLLTVAERERGRLGAPVITPDEIADRDAALATARTALGPDRAAAVTTAAAGVPLDDVLDEVRADLG